MVFSRLPEAARTRRVRAYTAEAQTLDNGLSVELVRMPHLHSAFVGCFVRVGSRHETAKTNGVSHFLEHMLFRGCDGYASPAELNAAIEDLGGQWEGFTTRDYTGYQTTVQSDAAPEALDMLGRMLTSPTYDDLALEKKIVGEEMLDSLDESGRNIELDTVAHAWTFADHPLGWPIEGTKAIVDRLDADGLELHRRRFYGAKNCVVCVAGRFDLRRVHRAIASRFLEMPAGRPRADGARPRVPATTGRLRYVPYPGPQTRLRITFRTPPEGHPDFLPLVLLRRWLDGGLSARLQVELVDRRGLAYEVGATIESYSDLGLFDFELNVAHDNIPPALEALSAIVDEVRREPLDPDGFARVQRRTRTGLDFMLDAPAELGGHFAVNRLFRKLETPEARAEAIMALEPRELRRVARRYLSPRTVTGAAVGGASKSQVRAARTAWRRFVRGLDD